MNEARARLSMSDGEIVERFKRFGYNVSIAHIAFTTETVDDFRQARKKWNLAGRLRTDEPGLIMIEEAQPRPGQPTRDVIVVGLGSSRAVMGVHIAAGAPPLPSGSTLCRFAPTMHWALPETSALKAAVAKR